MARSAFAPARSSSAISKSASTRLGLAIQHNAFVERVSKHTAGVQVRFSPCVDRAWNDVASKSASRDGPVDLVVIQQSLADDKKIVIAFRPICAACTAPEKDDSARMQSFHKAVYRLGKFDIVYRSPPHMSLYIGPRARIQRSHWKSGSDDGTRRTRTPALGRQSGRGMGLEWVATTRPACGGTRLACGRKELAHRQRRLHCIPAVDQSAATSRRGFCSPPCADSATHTRQITGEGCSMPRMPRNHRRCLSIVRAALAAHGR